jgi:predicted dienelactone hydrolase
MNRSIAIALLVLFLAPAAHGQEQPSDPAAQGTFLVRSDRLPVNIGGSTYIDLRLPAGPSVPRPVVLLSPGWAANTSDFTDIAEHLASRGFAVAIFEEKDSWSGDIEERAAHLRSAIDELTKANADPKSSVFGELDLSRLAIMGHSYGAAGAVVAAAQDSRIKAVVAMAPVSQWHKSDLQAKASALTVPLLVLHGSDDWIASASGDTKPVYDAAKNAPREYVNVKGVGHNFFQNGGAGTPQHALADRYSTAWLERYLEGKKDPGGYTDGTAARADQKAGLLTDSAVASPPPPPAPPVTIGLTGALGR